MVRRQYSYLGITDNGPNKSINCKKVQQMSTADLVLGPTGTD